MHKTVSVVYDLLLRQFEGQFTSCVLMYLVVFILAGILTSKNRTINFWVLLIGLLLLILSPIVYRLVVYVYYVNNYNF
jgi:hypothetical protein